MNEIIDDFDDVLPVKTNKKKGNALAAFLIMLIGGILYFKYINHLGQRADWSLVVACSFIFQFFCIVLNIITVFLGRLFSRNEAELESVRTNAFWLDRVVGGFMNWVILIGLILLGYFL